MGAFLDKPATEKETSTKEGKGMRAGLSSMQGWRVNQEDAHILNIATKENADLSFFAVFDGHGGEKTAQRCAEQLWQTIVRQPKFKEGSTAATLREALTSGFFEFDDELRRDTSLMEDRSGCTAVTVTITDTQIICANSGDSRAILVKKGATEALSTDHKPTDAPEKARIEAAGGFVQMGRVDGDLAVSRAFGDFTYKTGPPSQPAKQKVSVEPEFVVKERSADDSFVVLACDGIWDVMTNEEVGNFCRNLVAKGCDDMGELAELLIDNCLECGSRDNMSAIIIAMPGAPRAAEAAKKRWGELRAEAAAQDKAAAEEDSPGMRSTRGMISPSGRFLTLLNDDEAPAGGAAAGKGTA